MLNPAMGESVRDTLGRYVDDWDGHGPSGEAVDGGEKVAETV